MHGRVVPGSGAILGMLLEGESPFFFSKRFKNLPEAEQVITLGGYDL